MSTDPITRASAELLAAGVTGRERLLVLEVLGTLIDEAGPWGMVRPDPERIAVALHTDPDTVTRRIAALDHVGAIEPCGDRWQVVGAPARPHHGPSVASAMAILADPQPTRRADHARRLAPVSAAAAIVAVVMGTLAVVTASDEPPSPDQLVAVDTPSAPIGPEGTADLDPAAPLATPDIGAEPGARTSPAPASSPPLSSSVASTVDDSCHDIVLAATVRRVGRDLNEETIATGWTENTSAEELAVHTVVIEDHELVLPTPLPVTSGAAVGWAVVLDPAVAAGLEGAEPDSLVAAARATTISCLGA